MPVCTVLLPLVYSIVTFVPGLSRDSVLSSSCELVTLWSLMPTMMSPAWTPALAAVPPVVDGQDRHAGRLARAR